jgi:hypothetical protein
LSVQRCYGIWTKLERDLRLDCTEMHPFGCRTAKRYLVGTDFLFSSRCLPNG